ncbi:cysteine hydrolase family protein [Megalodesulfovibrio paquesii]
MPAPHSLPGDVHKENTALVFIEFQQEWLAPQGRLRQLLIRDEPDFLAATARAAELLAAGRAHGWRIVHAGLDLRQDPHYLVFNRGQHVSGLRAAIPNAGTWTGAGAEFAPPFTPRDGEYVVQGRAGASVFRHSTLDPFLRHAGVRTVVLLGFALHVCVESSLREAHDLGYNAVVPTDACGVFEPAQRSYFETHIIHHFGTLQHTAPLLDQLRS